MKVSGFTIIKNAVRNDYPVVEAIQSVLPMVDEMIVSIGNSEDETEALIRSIGSGKIKIIQSVWDPGISEGGEVLAVETNKAFDQVSADSDWVFYIQADEVVHEKYYAAIRKAMETFLHNNKVDGLLFHYLHFYGTYDYIGDSRKWYNKEVRIIRNDKSIRSYKDAQGFRKNGKKINVKPLDAVIFHYGWVKSLPQMRKKIQEMGKYWAGGEKSQENLEKAALFEFAEYDSIEKYKGTHPATMANRIAEKNWQIALDPTKKKFSGRGRLLYWIEKRTGKRLFDFRNYKII